MATVAQFQTRFPEFCDVDDDRIQLFLDDASLLMGNTHKWLDFYDTAHAYYSAHLVVVAEHTESGDIGIIAPAKKQEVDDVVIESALSAISPTMDDLYSTAYGKRYINYRNIILRGPRGV
jgi:hypothetical protein